MPTSIILTHDKNIVDGIHRLTKAYLLKKSTIKAYIFSKKLMNKFLLNKKGDWKKVDSIPIYVHIEIFFRRFCDKK